MGSFYEDTANYDEQWWIPMHLDQFMERNKVMQRLRLFKV
jgi:hypothetical protein